MLGEEVDAEVGEVVMEVVDEMAYSFIEQSQDFVFYNRGTWETCEQS